jgi:hypothetical protein
MASDEPRRIKPNTDKEAPMRQNARSDSVEPI